MSEDRQKQRPEAGAWVIEDVTHVRALEAELQRMDRELHRANRDLESLRELLRAQEEEHEELLTVVSHELRTPVTIIGGYNRLLLSEQVGPITDEQRRFLSESQKGCDRLEAFIGTLLEASRTASGGEVLEIAEQVLEPVIDAVLDLLRPLLDAAGLDAKVNIARDAERASFDRLRVEQVLTNLVGNAIKYAPLGGSIEIETRPRREPAAGGCDARAYVEISVSDGGPGVSPEDRERIFEPWVQTADGSPGAGLGLAICRRWVAAHGGSICVQERREGGSRFAFTLPVSFEPSASGGGAES